MHTKNSQPRVALKMSVSKIAVACVAVTLLAMAQPAQAITTPRTYTFTAADLINNIFIDGADSSTAADNGLFNGGRLLRDGTSGTSSEAARTYVQSQHSNFNSRWDDLVTAGVTLNSFNLWGLDGRGIHWGEDYKPLQWLDVSAPDGWSTGFHDAGPAGAGWFQNIDDTQSDYLDYNTPLFPWFYLEDGIALDETPENLEAMEFSVTVLFEDGFEFWGADTQGAPNDLDSQLTMWFGANLYDGEEYADMYEGNLTAVPTPVAGVVGLVAFGLLGMRRRRREQSLAAVEA